MEGPKLLLELDRVAGSVVESAIVRHHRRRLRKLGWSRALEPDGHALWAGGEPSPRPGNQLDVLVDGAEAFPAIAEAIAGAREYVHLAGWHVAPGFALTRCEPMVVLGTLLAEMAERATCAAWCGRGRRCPSSTPRGPRSPMPWRRSRAARGSAVSPTRASTRSTAITRRS